MTMPAASRPGPVEPPLVLRWFDLVVLAIALPIFLLGHLPILGWAVIAVVWVAQRLAQEVVQRRAAASKDPRTVVGLTAGSMLARAWIVALAVFGTGLADHDAGLAAAVLALALFTVYFTMNLVLRPLQKGRMPS